MMRRKTGKPRRGLTVVAVLVCLLVITVLGAALLKLTLAERDGNRHLERRLQAEWLLESGLDRALARLAQESRLQRRDLANLRLRAGAS